MRRRSAAAATDRYFCSTNGCASFLELDASTGVAICPICGFRRQTS
jgi:DNA-directed RNA polymerase subunit RPC12/RpoP